MYSVECRENEVPLGRECMGEEELKEDCCWLMGSWKGWKSKAWKTAHMQPEGISVSAASVFLEDLLLPVQYQSLPIIGKLVNMKKFENKKSDIEKGC